MTMKEIAKQLGISVATVSRAINNTGYISKDLQEKILKLVKKNNYVPNAIARNLSKNKNDQIAIIVPDLRNIFFAQLVSQICEYFYKNGLQVLVYNSTSNVSKELEIVNIILSQRPKAVIIISAQSNYKKNPYLAFKNKNIPCLLLDREIENCDFGGIFIDNFKGAYLLTQALIKEGHQAIGFISGANTLKAANDRLNGYLQALHEAKITVNHEHIFYGDFSLKSGISAGDKLAKEAISAVFAANNLMFLGALKNWQKTRNVKLKTVRLACFDAIDTLEILDWQFLNLQIPLKGIEKTLLNMILENSSERIYLQPFIKA